MRQDEDTGEQDAAASIPVTTTTNSAGQTVRTAETTLNGGRITASMTQGQGERDQFELRLDIEDDGIIDLTITTQENGFGYAIGTSDGEKLNQGIYRDQASDIAQAGRALLAKGSLSPDEFATFAVDAFNLAESGRAADITETVLQGIQRR